MITLPKNDLKKQEILQKIAKKVEKNKNYTEEQVNKIIESFNVEDSTLFRRELVNFNYLGKDSYKEIYWLKKYILSEDELVKIESNQKKIEKGGVY
ncbi:MAG: DUF2087 domain-containing protein [Nanoarchaeota archaeon]|nr:DUF2087 domain-containing protein [Nanoarchaeota archaeon]